MRNFIFFLSACMCLYSCRCISPKAYKVELRNVVHGLEKLSKKRTEALSDTTRGITLLESFEASQPCHSKRIKRYKVEYEHLKLAVIEYDNQCYGYIKRSQVSTSKIDNLIHPNSIKVLEAEMNKLINEDIGASSTIIRLIPMLRDFMSLQSEAGILQQRILNETVIDSINNNNNKLLLYHEVSEARRDFDHYLLSLKYELKMD